jgi:hypothetical protein
MHAILEMKTKFGLVKKSQVMEKSVKKSKFVRKCRLLITLMMKAVQTSETQVNL